MPTDRSDRVSGALRAVTRLWALALGAGVAAALLFQAAPQAADAAATPQYPDLKTLPPSDLRFDQVTIDGVSQWVLRFSNTVWNDGAGPLHVVPTNVGDKTTVTQWVFGTTVASGEPLEKHFVGESEFHPQHNHWHVKNFAKYELYTAAEWQRTDGTPRGRGEKTTFCIIDLVRLSGNLSSHYNDCGQTSVTGLSVGWGDIYGASLFDQWVVLGQSRLTRGDYVLRSIADPLNRIHESPDKASPNETAEDNQALTCFSVRFNRIRGKSC